MRPRGFRPTREVVVCRCGEDLSWTGNLPLGVTLTIYDKTPPPERPWPDSLPLPNEGREAHTWLHHLVERYDTLADLTFFAQGKPFDHAPDFHSIVRRFAPVTVPIPDFLWLGFLWETDDARGRPSFIQWSKNPRRRELALDEFFPKLFQEPAPPLFRYVGGGQFILSLAAARRRPRSFYEQARQISLTFPDAAHAFERTWDKVFLATPLDPSLFGPSGLRLLKPVKAKAVPLGSSRRS